MMNLVVSDIHYAYGEHKVLKGFDFSAEYGEMIYILGVNGAGKSTLFSCILGHEVPSRGYVCINGKNINTFSEIQMARQMAYIPQFTRSAFNYSVLDMVLMGRTSHISLFNTPSREDKKLARELLEKMGVGHLAKRNFLEISGGERRLALIARALLQEAKILIMDEPCANLDYGNAIRVQKQLKALTDEGYLILQSSHDPQHVLLFADRVVVLNNGKVQISGAPSEVMTEELLKDIYQIPVKIDGDMLKPII